MRMRMLRDTRYRSLDSAPDNAVDRATMHHHHHRLHEQLVQQQAQERILVGRIISY